MNFTEKVHEQFRKAGWYEGRNISAENDKIKNFDKLPDFLREFLNEYGSLKVDTIGLHVIGLFDLTRYSEKHYIVDEFLNKESWFGHGLNIVPIGHYREDNATICCDFEGNVYTDCDFPGHISDNFLTGIEKVILEDYSNIKYWDEHTKIWSENQV